MQWLLDLSSGLNHFLLFTLVLTRVSGLVITAPIFGGNDVPPQVRAMLAFALAVLVTPTQLATTVAAPTTLLGYLLVMGSELLVGLTLGLGITILLSGLQLTGQIIGQLSGMALAEVFNPAFDTSVPLISQILHLFALAVFVTIGGHRLVMGGLLGTFETMPPGTGFLSTTLTEAFTTLATQSFVLGIRAAAPATAALLLATVVLGLISRTLPQLNVLSFGFGINALVTFGALWFSLGAIGFVFQEQIEPAMELLVQAIAGVES